MKEFSINGQLRSATGKKATRELRRQGLVPCNIYGVEKDEKGLPKAIAFCVPATDLRKLIYTPHIYLVNITLEGKSCTAIMKELQFHPVNDQVLHIDFLEVTEDKPITIGVPVKLNGLAQGVRDGGKLQQQIRKINVTALYKDVPEVLNIDVTKLTIGKSIKVGELQFDNLEMATSKEVVVCTVKATRKSNTAAQETEEEA